MAQPDSTKYKQEKAGDKVANVAHVVTPDPDEDPTVPKLGVVKERDAAAALKKRERRPDNGPMHVGVNFDASDT